MHGLTNRAIQRFVTDSYGIEKWNDAVRWAALDVSDFEAMLTYEDGLTEKAIVGVCFVLDKPRSDVMEDIGTYLVSHPNTEALRRLLRFGGVTFVEFLNSLDDLPDRARLAVSDLELPSLEVRDHSSTQFSLVCACPIVGFGHVMMGILRTMADDYGVLAVFEHMGSGQGVETISISLVVTEFTEGRKFELGARVE
ncbi:heme NO-binding domain-containing protein [Ascidiaceihabitans sp.]|uniref:heme NO-binding domain-containing protein n=1 Tax=Ascidiaceihabitans sp. TaxID=1872644 RepID=UPI003299EE13